MDVDTCIIGICRSVICLVSWDIIDCFVLAVRLMNQSNSEIVMHSLGNEKIYAGCQCCKYFIVVL